MQSLGCWKTIRSEGGSETTKAAHVWGSHSNRNDLNGPRKKKSPGCPLRFRFSLSSAVVCLGLGCYQDVLQNWVKIQRARAFPWQHLWFCNLLALRWFSSVTAPTFENSWTRVPPGIVWFCFVSQGFCVALFCPSKGQPSLRNTVLNGL